MNIESQGEQINSSEKLILGIQRELIIEFCNGNKKKTIEWITKYSELFRKMVEENPELVWDYPQTKNEIKNQLYAETIH